MNIRFIKKYFWLLLPCYLLATCVSPVDLNVVSLPPTLTVSGLINNDGTCFVRLNRSTTYEPDLTLFHEPVLGALTFLHSSKGEQYPMFEYNEPGKYELSEFMGFTGEVGVEYWIRIEMEDGKVYESRPEMINEVPTIGDVYYEIEDRLTKSLSGFDITIYGMQFFVKTEDPTETKNQYRWSWNATRELNTVKPPPSLDPFDPPINCCFQCWIDYFPSEEVTIFSDERSNGKVIEKQPIVFFKYDSNMPKMELTISQSSLTAEAYQYWKQVKSQQENTGSVFEPAPATILGNVYNVEDPDEVVFGWFGASAITYKKVQLQNIYIEEDLPGQSPEPMDCRTIQNSTDVRPEDPFWGN
ncbi:DUF4249 domain-containing protein [Flammeovirgaceae bacterium SG7u.111]|nr:DUF4249 domain-containing protein [Flammeovirgaceae bacterium SG7u.132]WPO33251.1 DUF4249 domain-containing protein [Flammeovirgaceae bacterium SG7u.111]